MKAYFVPCDGLLQFVSERQDHTLAGPAPTGGMAWLNLSDAEPSLETLSQPRAAQSPKGFFLPACESLGRYGPAAQSATAVRASPIVLLGVRACELRAREYFDKVMLGGAFDDPAYAARRQAALVVSCDCVAFADTCFCTLVGGRPYAEEGFDVNLTPVGDGFVAEVGSDKGMEWLGKAGWPEASAQQLASRQRLREQATEGVRRQNAEFTFTASDESASDLPEGDSLRWQEFSADCVECAACTNICPTCHCFYLYDQALGPEEFERVRTWDSCLLSTYHRMAGGANVKLTPRPSLSSRLANRVLHKFVYSPQQYQRLGCVGCGRCIDACLGEIDIRQVVESLGSQVREAKR